MSKPTVFISYCHKDEDWKDRLVTHLGVSAKQGLLELWDDRRIGAGEDWYKAICGAIDKGSIAVLLVSANSLTSEFILKEEVPRLLKHRDEEAVRIFPIVIKPCDWEAVPWLKRMNLRPKDGKPLSGGTDFQIDADLTVIAKEIRTILARAVEQKDPEAAVALDPEKISLSRLPITGKDLFGRKKELELIDDAWNEKDKHVLSLVAWGGVGKSALVNHWLQGMAKDHYRGAERVFGWSFYSQGTTDKAVSADQFIDAALRWFGDEKPTEGSPWDKGERLAQLVKKQRTLLILDGLEPMQYPPGPDEGKLKEQSLQALLRELAADNPGLCIISTRLAVADLEQFENTTAQRVPLEELDEKAGAQVLRALGVEGTDAELEQASRDFGGHALALTLLGSFLRDVHGGDIRKRREIGPLAEDLKHGGHARRVMTSYEKWLGEGPELAVLRMLGLFNRPADGPSVAALRKPPTFPWLTDKLQDLSEKKWQQALVKLRHARLLAPKDETNPDELDAHPLVREHFGQQLRQNNPEAWREGNSRLYEHLKTTTKEFPDTIEEMMPLYAAVAHGCEAELYQQALVEVYIRRIQRGNRYFSTSRLGTFGTDLAVLDGFFDSPWDRAVALLTAPARSLVLVEAGARLRGLGRLKEAVRPFRAGLGAHVSAKDWANAANDASNLSQLHQTMGELSEAVECANRGTEWADRSSDEFIKVDLRGVLADTQHQMGHISEAEGLFREAEEMQKKLEPNFPLLVSALGSLYCDLLLGQGKYEEVLSRASTTLQLALKQKILLDLASDHVSLGKAYLLQAQIEGTIDFRKAEAHLKEAADGLRKAGQLDFLPKGLLARAELYRVTHEFVRAEKDLNEAMSIATRSGMRLYEADCYLGYARLYLAQAENEKVSAKAQEFREKARESWEKAKKMVEEMGYHRRDGEVAEIEKKLNVER